MAAECASGMVVIQKIRRGTVPAPLQSPATAPQWSHHMRLTNLADSISTAFCYRHLGAKPLESGSASGGKW
jgi:hypothetical protein